MGWRKPPSYGVANSRLQVVVQLNDKVETPDVGNEIGLEDFQLTTLTIAKNQGWFGWQTPQPGNITKAVNVYAVSHAVRLRHLLAQLLGMWINVECVNTRAGEKAAKPHGVIALRAADVDDSAVGTGREHRQWFMQFRLVAT